MNEIVPFGGWPNCRRLANERLELIATTDIGPRIMRFGLAGGPNQFGYVPADLGQTGGDEYRLYGGHRLLRSPEVPELIYLPDNSPIEANAQENSLCLTQPVEAAGGLQKSLHVCLNPEYVSVVHTLTNRGSESIEAAPWAITIMAPGGLAFAAMPAPTEELLPDRAVVMWPYARMDDPRVRWGGRLVNVQQDPARPEKFKFGLTVTEGWLAYLNAGTLFVKLFQSKAAAVYPDFGTVAEVYTDDRFLELETLGPLATLAPGDCITHVETWHLFAGVECHLNDEDSILAAVTPLIERARQAGSKDWA